MPVDTWLLFLDANVLAAPVTRTLIMIGADPSGLRVTWSAYAETEANRHLRTRAMSVTALRALLGRSLSATGSDPDRFTHTSGPDRQILADAVAAGAGFLITNNVRHFNETELLHTRIAAVTPDRFMASRYTEAGYTLALQQIIANTTNPPRTLGQMHALVNRQHPHLFQRHATLYPVEPARSPHHPPTITYRGARCLHCGRHLPDPHQLTLGIGPECHAKH